MSSADEYSCPSLTSSRFLPIPRRRRRYPRQFSLFCRLSMNSFGVSSPTWQFCIPPSTLSTSLYFWLRAVFASRIHQLARPEEPSHYLFYTNQWVALKRSKFVNFVDPENPCAGCVLPQMWWLSDSAPSGSAAFSGSINSFTPPGKNRDTDSRSAHPQAAGSLSRPPISSRWPTLISSCAICLYATSSRRIHLEKVFIIDPNRAWDITMLPDTFYVPDGLNADPVPSHCLTLFIFAPLRQFQGSALSCTDHAALFPLLDLRCRAACHPEIDLVTVDDRYWRYGGIARYVFCHEESLAPSIESVLSDCKSSILSTDHLGCSQYRICWCTFLLNFQHVILASRYIGVLLFSKYFEETLDNLKSIYLLAELNLLECYIHFLLEFGCDEPLSCRSLEGPHCFNVHLYC